MRVNTELHALLQSGHMTSLTVNMVPCYINDTDWPAGGNISAY